ncbi:MAG: phosphoglucosamine mutase [Chlamydiales bacterium]|nr:phosphoglucosamine mutase [Chlamydiales bacterium]
MTATTPRKLFGTDGVRGRANKAPMTIETAMALGRAAGKVLGRTPGRHRVVIGKDTRVSCYMYENALIAGLCSMGIDTLMVGPLPTPGVAFLTRAYRASAGIVISASHNAYYDNGIKFFSSDGFKLPDSWESEMEQIITQNNFSDCLPADDAIGRNTRVVGADGRYVEFVKATFPKGRSLRGLKLVVDCSHGACYKVAPLVFRELDAEVHTYGVEPNGLNINGDCGSMHPQKTQRAVLYHGADVGIAFDGDADRVVMVDENSQIVDGDMILAICAKHMQRRGALHNNKVVSTVMCNYGFLEAMQRLGIEVVRSQVGDRYVIQEMIKHGANLGGEQSGHIIFLDHNTTGDGLVSAMQVLGIMVETGSKLSELASIVTRYPQFNVNVPVASKPPLEDMKKVQDIIQNVEKLLANKGRVIVRYSGTENICRVMVEGKQANQVESQAEEIANVIRDEIGQQK